MRACSEEIEHGGEDVRSERHGRLQGGADIPTMDGEFRDPTVDQGVHGDNAERMKTGLVPIFCAQGGDKMREGVPGVAERRTPGRCQNALGWRAVVVRVPLPTAAVLPASVF